ncbi:hypothetical protein DR864_02555 [Runella rosea]|uniref:Hsp70 family protein n=1 Tax=Runella rosea TaxID=2259595 RepID=A0A344TDG7_9BACT|nr:hypothetical protein [Runella rosea]AXE16688.1 hypothetical protein DR864_02555 [Runella rosea]
MKKYNIGLDFGTFQTKSCVYSIENDTHEFFIFSNGSYFLLSQITENLDGRFEYGNDKSLNIKEEYVYFKIAAAEDYEFHVETYGKPINDSSFYIYNRFRNYTPEFLSVVYITYVLFSIKEHYKSLAQKATRIGGLLSKYTQNKSENDDIEFTVQLGIPTEWSQKKNIKRKRKFENILLISEMLQKKYNSKDDFLNASTQDLKADVLNIYNSYKHFDEISFDSYINNFGISVYPETAAGLTFIVKTRQLEPGYYAIMDIGGGSTDISFFSIQIGGEIRYLASESYLLAANNVYINYANQTPSLANLKDAEIEVISKINTGQWKNNKSLNDTLEKINKQLNAIIYKLFNKRVYWFNKEMTRNYSNKPIILYGGGSRLPIINSDRVLIHDNGNSTSLKIPLTYLEKQEIHKFTSIINILPSNETWKSDFPILAVALGLSFIKPKSSVDWFNINYYNYKDGDRLKTISHPVNEGYYIYDILNSRWEY